MGGYPGAGCGPLIVYPHFNLWIGIAVILCLYLAVTIAVRRSLSAFPFYLPQWTKNPRELLLEDVIKQD